MPETYTIYTRWVAFELCKLGFKIVETGTNENHPWLETYVFKNSPELQTAITTVTTARKN